MTDKPDRPKLEIVPKSGAYEKKFIRDLHEDGTLSQVFNKFCSEFRAEIRPEVEARMELVANATDDNYLVRTLGRQSVLEMLLQHLQVPATEKELIQRYEEGAACQGDVAPEYRLDASRFYERAKAILDKALEEEGFGLRLE